MTGKVPAAVGQLWESTDRRERRRVRVEAFNEWPGYATVARVDARGQVLGGRLSRIRLDNHDRLSRYRLVREGG